MSSLVTVRDVAIIVLTFVSLLVGFLLIWLIFEVRSLAKVLKEEVEPILGSAKETVNTVRGTASFVSDRFVSPLIKMASFAAGVKGGLEFLARHRRRRRGE